MVKIQQALTLLDKNKKKKKKGKPLGETGPINPSAPADNNENEKTDMENQVSDENAENIFFETIGGKGSKSFIKMRQTINERHCR